MLFSASGGAAIREGAKLVIRFSRKGCTNRPFYHIQVSDKYWEPSDQCIEQVGTYDPMPNERNEKLASLNFERIRYWMGQGASLSHEAKVLLGLAGFMPIHPSSYIHAWQKRRAAELPEPPMPKKLTWRERQKILMQQAEEQLKQAEARDSADATSHKEEKKSDESVS